MSREGVSISRSASSASKKAGARRCDADRPHEKPSRLRFRPPRQPTGLGRSLPPVARRGFNLRHPRARQRAPLSEPHSPHDARAARGSRARRAGRARPGLSTPVLRKEKSRRVGPRLRHPSGSSEGEDGSASVPPNRPRRPADSRSPTSSRALPTAPSTAAASLPCQPARRTYLPAGAAATRSRSTEQTTSRRSATPTPPAASTHATPICVTCWNTFRSERPSPSAPKPVRTLEARPRQTMVARRVKA